MGFVVSSLTDYTEKATEILRSGVLFTDDLSRYYVQPGISYKEYLNYIDALPYVQAGDCGLTSSGTTTFTEKTLEVMVYAFRQSFCVNDLRKKALPQASSTLTGDMGPGLEVTLTDAIMDKIKEKVESDLWVGTGADLIDGWLPTLSGCSGAISLDTYPTSAVTIDNIDEIVDDFIDNITNAMRSRGKLTIHVSMGVYNLYKRNRLAANYYYDQGDKSLLDANEMWLFGYEGMYTIKGEAGFAVTDYMLMTWDKNLYLGTDEVNELSSAKWVYDEVTNYVWFQSSFKLGTQIAFCDECIHNMY